MKTPFRWILVIPSAIGAYVGGMLVMVFIALLGRILHAGESPWWTAIATSVLCGWAFVEVGTNTAPSRKVCVSIVLAAIVTLMHAYVFAYSTIFWTHNIGMTIRSGVFAAITAASAIGTCISIYKKEKNKTKSAQI